MSKTLQHRVHESDSYDPRDHTPITIMRHWNRLGIDPDVTFDELKIAAEAGNLNTSALIAGNCRHGAVNGEGCNGGCHSAHHHGMTSLPAFDGWANDLVCPGEWKDYVYGNDNGGTVQHMIDLNSHRYF